MSDDPDPLISYHDAGPVEWKEFRPGSQWKVLLRDDRKGQLVFLVRWAAGYRMGGPECVKREKHLYILDGTFVDQNRSSGAGTYLYVRPGAEIMAHTPDGCTFLEIVPGDSPDKQ